MSQSLLNHGTINNEPKEGSTHAVPVPEYSRFTRRQRWLIVVLATISATFSGFASNIYFPAIPHIAHDLGTSIENINLTVTTYMVFQALTPTLWGALSDVYGRRVTLMSTKSLKLDIAAPIRILFYPEVFVTLLFLSLHYATWQMAVTAQSSLFNTIYGLDDLHIGLTFLANGFGCMIGTLTTGKLLDHDYKRMQANFTGNPADFPIEHARLHTVWFWSPLQWFAMLLFGWSLDKRLHVAAPIVASFVLAWAAMSIQSVISTLVVDVFPTQSASATAALNLARCLLGAASTAAVEPTMKRIGTGWTFTLWTGLLVMSLVLVGVQQRWGAIWRKRREARERDKETM
ncbi:hypothetical protein CspHIS471_0402600 [Cutaneotrichosporon sp. HIS471]|nr:hypothetical protein CspHIS471_0402600 [Cutaneotrichosporon sp. HIS471]